MNKSNINLEPRLVEYLKRKQFYEDNDINSPIGLEKQYSITKDDIEKIKKFNLNQNIESDSESESEAEDYENQYKQNKRKNLKTKVNFEDDSHLLECTNSKFPMTNIYDARLERINEKVRREKDANKYRGNTTNLQKSYDMYSRNFSSTTSKDFEGEFNLDNIKEEINKVNDKIYEANSNYNTHELVNPPSKHQYNVPPKIQYNQQLHYQKNNSNQNTLGKGYISYKKPELPKFQNQNKFDMDTKTHIVSNNCRKSDLNMLYEGVAEMTNAPLKNIDFENYVKYGYPTSKARSLGFENPYEHQFQYIDEDIQNPDHVVFDRPMASRLDNKTQQKFTQRDIY